jgi:3-hydroxyacyl-CoA dehydrogenase
MTDAARYLAEAELAVGNIPGVPAYIQPRPTETAAVIGAGTMGSGIAMALANAGVAADLVDVGPEALARALARIRGSYAASVSKGRLTRDAADRALGLIRPLAGLEHVSRADVIIEAAFERMDVKLAIFRELDRIAKPGAVLATNTSMLDVDEIAAGTSRPQDVVGLHFFSPAHIMRLIEVVRGRRTGTEVLATVSGFARKIGKIPVVVGVCDGFVGNRMIEPYFREAEFLVAEGASPLEVDYALTEFGMAMGPFAMADMAGIDVRWDVVRRRAALRAPGERYSALVERLVELGRNGQKAGAGFYRYEPGSRTPVEDPSIHSLFESEAARQGVKRRHVSSGEIVQRCLLALVNEGAWILEDRIVPRASDIDVIYVRGYGFPASKGGPMFWADTIGARRLVTEMAELESRLGAVWRPAPMLAALAAGGGRITG